MLGGSYIVCRGGIISVLRGALIYTMLSTVHNNRFYIRVRGLTNKLCGQACVSGRIGILALSKLGGVVRVTGNAYRGRWEPLRQWCVWCAVSDAIAR